MKRLFQVIFYGLTSVCVLGVASAQEENEGSETTEQRTEMTVLAGDGFAAPMIFSTSENIDGNGMSSGVQILSGLGGMPMSFTGNAVGNFPMPAPDPWSMIDNPSVQKDLELVGDQLNKVKELQRNFAQQMKERIGDLSKGGINPDRFKGLGEVMAKLREEQKLQMEKVLLPHQIERLKQVALQTHMKQAGTSNALASNAVAEALNITDEQKEKLKTRAKEINEQLKKDIEALRQKAKEGLLKEVLTTEQRTSLKKMIGEKYEPQNKDLVEQFKGLSPRTERRLRSKQKN